VVLRRLKKSGLVFSRLIKALGKSSLFALAIIPRRTKMAPLGIMLGDDEVAFSKFCNVIMVATSVFSVFESAVFILSKKFQ